MRLLILITSLIAGVGILFLPNDVSSNHTSNNKRKGKGSKKGSES